MIKRLRKNIILVNMLLVGIVILMIFSVVCVNSYTSAVRELETGLEQAVERYGHTSYNHKGFYKEMKNSAETSDEPPTVIGRPDMRGESPAQLSSYIVVDIDSSGNIFDSYESNVTMDEDDLESCVAAVLERNSASGQLQDFGLMYVKMEEFGNTSIAFADNSGLYSSLRNTAFISAGLFLGSMVIIFIISLGLSKLAVKPVKEAWEKQKQFVADASHELKTPLTVILANNNIMMSHTDSMVSDERQWLDSTQEEAQHMKQLIDQMLFLAKSDAGGSNVELTEVNFSEIVEGASLNFEPVAYEKEIDIAADITPDIILNGNSLQLNQLAHILIDNAVKYANSKTTVTIQLLKQGEATEFSVNNVGNVIAKEDLAHIFDRFYRAEKSRTTNGYGLGLSIAQNIVQSMNGKLSVTSNEKDGTTFTAIFR